MFMDKGSWPPFFLAPMNGCEMMTDESGYNTKEHS